MSATPGNPAAASFNPAELAEAITRIAGGSHAVMQEFLQHEAGKGMKEMDPLGVGQAFLALTGALMTNPQRLMQAQVQAWNAYMNLWFGTASRMLGNGDKAGSGKDRRFRHEAWENNPFFDFLRQSYLVAADTIQNVVTGVDGLDEKTAKKIHFFTRQFIDALSPTNFVLTNPEVLEATIQSGGQNLLKGLQSFVEDFDAESGQLRIKMTDLDAFELGRNVATTPGKVVFQNRLLQLIQYAPATSEVYRRPLLVMPPWINKYYILDLQPRNSLVKWLTEQGHTVFMISWVNPDQTLAQVDFQDYLFEGPLAALDAIEQATGEREVNVIGYCIGGTLLAAALAWMAAKGDTRIRSATFLTTMLDFTEPGDLGVFVDEQQLERLEKAMGERGYHEGSEMASSFNMLRANDLIWSFFINHYLLGKDPVPFDLLYWNSDCTRLPAKMHSTYLRTMYLENRFKDPGGMQVGDVAIDLRNIRTPSYFLSTEEDHIAPWRSTYAGAQLLSGPVRFVLGRSGHIAGVVNPPAAKKYGYYQGPGVSMDADGWYGAATLQEGSWWPNWQAWVAGQGMEEKVPARQPGSGALPVMEDAPGSYARVRLG